MNFLSKMILIFTLLTRSAFQVSAQPLVSPESYKLSLLYREKQESNYKVMSATTKVKDGKEITEGSRYNMNFKIVSYTDTSAIMEIRYSNIEAIGEKQPGFDEMAKLTTAMTIKVALDKSGSYVEFMNYHECKKTFDQMLNAIKKEMKQDTINLRLWRMLAPIFSDRQTIEYILLEDFFHLAFAYGPELSRKTPLTSDVFMNNLYQGDPYPAKLVIKAGSTVPNNFFEVFSRIDLDKKAGKSIIKETLAQLTGITQITDMQIQKFNFFDTYSHVFDVNNGWMKEMTYKRTVSIDKGQSLKEVKFRQLN